MDPVPTPNSFSKIFFDQGNTLRSGWRFAVFVTCFIILGGFAGALTYLLLRAAFPPTGPSLAAAFTINSVVSAAAALAVSWFCLRFLERIPFRSLGAWITRGWALNFLVGLSLGGATFAVAALIGVALGGLGFGINTADGFSSKLTTLAVSFLIFAAAAAFEELLLRGYILQTFVRSNLAFFAVVFTSVVFATLHNANPSATWMSWLNTFLAGVWLAVAYLRTRDLWLPFGLHLAWNWVQGSIFGVEVSGLTEIVKAPLMRESDAGPDWLTGGDYGIEGGVACTVALILSIAAVHFLPGLKADPELAAMSSPERIP